MELKHPLPPKPHKIVSSTTGGKFETSSFGPHPLLSCGVDTANAWTLKMEYCLKLLNYAFQFCHFKWQSHRNNLWPIKPSWTYVTKQEDLCFFLNCGSLYVNLKNSFSKKQRDTFWILRLFFAELKKKKNNLPGSSPLRWSAFTSESSSCAQSTFQYANNPAL